MYILGLNLLHDTSATLIKDGDIIGAVEEERFNGQKHSDQFPIKSINWLLNIAGITLKDIDHFVTSFDIELFKENSNPFEENVIEHHDQTPEGLFKIKRDNSILYQRIVREMEKNGITHWEGVNHHLSHAAGSYYLSQFDESNILVIDGRGENVSTSLYYAKNQNIELIDNYPISQSLGQLYTYVTKLCGLYSNRGQEGKTMGLAAYGKEDLEIKEIFSKIITFEDGKYNIDRSQVLKLNKYARETGEIDDKSSTLAYYLQDLYERTLRYIVENLTMKTGCRNLVLSGGVTLNCNGNGLLISEKLVDNIYIQPAANDGGTSLGCALYFYKQITKGKEISLKSDVYLGPKFANHDIEDILKLYKIQYRKSTDITQDTARLLASGNIIGWFQGAMEFGPRALGNRSILADPRDINMKNKVNDVIKFRESWRPFAPSILLEHTKFYFENSVESPHMTISFKVRENMIEKIPAAIHVDGTARIQTVSEFTNSKYYQLINEFYKLTGVPVLLNTSFNGQEPMVCSPRDAIRTFYSSGLDFLVMGDYIVEKAILNQNLKSKEVAYSI